MWDDDYDNWNSELFPSVEELMKASNLDILDVIKGFSYGKGKEHGYGKAFVIAGGGINHDDKRELLESYWLKSIDKDLGPCFTFDPLRNNISTMVPGAGLEPTSIQLYLTVSFLLCCLIHITLYFSTCLFMLFWLLPFLV